MLSAEEMKFVKRADPILIERRIQMLLLARLSGTSISRVTTEYDKIKQEVNDFIGGALDASDPAGA